MGELDGRVAIITGAGRGLGREHALLFANEGAKVVVNDLGGAGDGSGSDAGPAQEVVEEIKAAGGEAVADTSDVTSWDGAKGLVQKAVGSFGRLDVLVNNAGILRDSFIAGMDEEQWDAIMHVHLKGHFCPLRHAAEHWKNQSKAGETVKGSVINTASPSGLILPNPGQTNYGAAKAGIASLTQVAALELARYGVRVNCIAPGARTRLTLATPGMGDMMKEPEDPDAFDAFHPGNISPIVAFLATEDCPETGQVYFSQGGFIQKLRGWTNGDTVCQGDHRPTIEDIRAGISNEPATV